MGKHDNASEARIAEEYAAGNGLFRRRTFMLGGLFAAGVSSAARAAADIAATPEWMKTPGGSFSGYGTPAKAQEKVQRIYTLDPGWERTGVSKTPLQLLEGIITPNGLHFERHHNGVPDIDPNRHNLFVHGLVRRPLAFSLEALMRYPMETHIRFIECAGNSSAYTRTEPLQASAGSLNGLISCSEWTGVRLATLLEEAGVLKEAKWAIAEGADAAAMSRSVPLEKCLDDALVALFQNGEAIRPEQGYPMRLLLPGFEGNMNVKWLRRLKLMKSPVNARDETSHYTELMPNGIARQYMLLQSVKSVILKPSFGAGMNGPGIYEISGLAWSGSGRISKVELSADAGKSWAVAALAEPVLPKSLVRFRLPWRWDGRPSILASRATDESGDVQPTRSQWLAQYAPHQGYHFNAIQSWGVQADGSVRNVYI